MTNIKRSTSDDLAPQSPAHRSPEELGIKDVGQFFISYLEAHPEVMEHVVDWMLKRADERIATKAAGDKAGSAH